MANALNSVEIRKIRVTPLGEWSYLLKRSPPQQCSWPRTSDKLCWWCCHSFTNVPAYLPVSVKLDVEKGIGAFVFTGNFCSWNCVKRYAVLLETQRKLPEGCYFIGLLAYLTVCKGQPCDGGEAHELGLCDCMEAYRGVRLPESREMLQAFGGRLCIDEFRRGFHAITEYANVERNFTQLDAVTSVKQEALISKNAKFWGFHYLNYAGPDASYTTYVNILPLTNRTFDKKALVRTGNESMEHANKLGGATASDAATQPPPPSTSTRRQPGPKAKRISRRGPNNKTNAEPTALSTIQPGHDDDGQRMDVVATQDEAPDDKPTTRPPPGRIMTQEQVLECNDEQHFYANSLRGYGNILTSMGIEISRPP